jgi:hypothetical protein
MKIPDPNLLAAWAQAIAEVLAPVVLIGTLVFALRAPQPGEGDAVENLSFTSARFGAFHSVQG